MQNLHYGLILLMMLMGPVTSAKAQVSIGIGLPNVSIGINLPVFPELVLVPGYPVYYAPQMDSNYFFYDGMYWVYQDDTWYASSWYNGPWGPVQPEVVPLFILRVPVRYYRQPPVYFRGWQSNAPPRWGQHWGRGWEQQRGGWNKWKRSSTPAPAPLPVYQRQYSGDRYPRAEQQHSLRNQQYRYQPRETIVRQHLKPQGDRNTAPAAQRGKQEAQPQSRTPRQPEPQRAQSHQQGAPPDRHSQPPQRGGENAQRPAPVHSTPQQRAPEAREQRQQPRVEQQPRTEQKPRAEQPQREHQAPRAQGQEQRSQGRGESQESNRDRGPGQNRDDDRGRGRDK